MRTTLKWNVSVFLAALVAPVAAPAITLDFVTVGDVGNPNDQVYSGSQAYGSVDYAYGIGKHEVTLNQYTAFLNAVAATDPYNLFQTEMATVLNVAGITRSGSSGSYSYSAIGDGSRPVVFVTWFDAARFSNWLHNG